MSSLNFLNTINSLPTSTIIPKGIRRFGSLCYVISAIQTLRYLDINHFDSKKTHIIEKIREGDLNYIYNYFKFPNTFSSARDALIRICNECGIEIVEYFNDKNVGNINMNVDSKNIIIMNYFDNFLDYNEFKKFYEDDYKNYKKYLNSTKLSNYITTNTKIYYLRSATFFSPVSEHYITLIFRNEYIYVLNDDKIYKIINKDITSKLDYFGTIYYCECAIYE